jgi:hypothetical protein
MRIYVCDIIVTTDTDVGSTGSGHANKNRPMCSECTKKRASRYYNDLTLLALRVPALHRVYFNVLCFQCAVRFTQLLESIPS